MPSNKKHNKNKHKNNAGNSANNNNKTNNSHSSTTTATVRQFEQPKKLNLSLQARIELKDLIALLLKTVYVETSNPKEEWEQYLKIQEILKRIQILEQPLKEQCVSSSSPKGNRLANIDKFYQWAKENGLQYENVEITEFPGYDLGLKATRDIKKDEILFGIPHKMVLSEEHADCAFVRDFFQPSNLKLAFLLMVEALKPDSFWKPYIDLLPETYNTVLYFTVEEMTQLKGSNALAAALKQCRLIARLYAVIYHWPSSQIPMADFKELFHYDLYRWAVSTVMTRENLIPRTQPKREGDLSDTIAALIPFWDMANHRDGTITTFFNMETQQVESSAQEDYKAGEQIFIYYGDRTNSDLMIHNGFINPSNPKDKISIKLGLSPSDVLYEKRAKLLELLNIPKNSELKVLPAPEFISPELLAFVRVFNMNEEQLDHWIGNAERAMDLLHIDCALETSLETKTWQYLQTRLMLLLRVFPQTLEEDEQQLALVKEKKVEMSSRAAMILEYRVLEKRILAAALDYAKQRTKA
ncbi:actin-histidine N-methyltransferase [Musca vetustissima]|uniref:actin-histidine N-methyltransferase n=1 Tax=Musca vetustissima TaxID=27455 RepID=UPI002AB7A317|nr:actin-histidine N-methyltransferase [Musca vetustissima]